MNNAILALFLTSILKNLILNNEGSSLRSRSVLGQWEHLLSLLSSTTVSMAMAIDVARKEEMVVHSSRHQLRKMEEIKERRGGTMGTDTSSEENENKGRKRNENKINNSYVPSSKTNLLGYRTSYSHIH